MLWICSIIPLILVFTVPHAVVMCCEFVASFPSFSSSLCPTPCWAFWQHWRIIASWPGATKSSSSACEYFLFWNDQFTFPPHRGCMDSGVVMNIHLRGYKLGGLGTEDSQWGPTREAPVGGPVDEAPTSWSSLQTLFADFDRRKDQNLKISHNSPPHSWPVCYRPVPGAAIACG